MRPDYTRSVFSPELSIIVHNFAHKLLDQFLADSCHLAGYLVQRQSLHGDDRFIPLPQSSILSGVFGKELVDIEILERAKGFEPSTPTFARLYSKSDNLSGFLSGRLSWLFEKLVGVAGFEPATPSSRTSEII
jgi:hypothetical protein